jgi:hypothetical protein
MANIARAYCNAAFSLSFTAKNAAGTAFDLTGCTVTGWIKLNSNSTTYVVDLTPTIPTPANGIISVLKTDAQMTINPGRYIYGIKLKNSAGNTICIIEKPINFMQKPPTSAA